MTLGALAGGAAQVGLAAVFVAAAPPKVLATAELTYTLERLGVHPAIARAASPVVVAAEFLTVLGLLVSPRAALPRGLALVLAAGFTAAGMKALADRERVACACFGAFGRSARLGWRQVRLFPAWLLLVVVAQSHPPEWEATFGLQVLATLALALTVALLATGVPLWSRMRGDRIAIRQEPAIEPAGLVEAG